ncbi:MAG: hypothetical protein LBI57_07245 [Helicobacteraceae bacterium]|jgi:hypothetical protein|nr:hypothetical protein [Helicobacteraceae bacterium]
MINASRDTADGALSFYPAFGVIDRNAKIFDLSAFGRSEKTDITGRRSVDP